MKCFHDIPSAKYQPLSPWKPTYPMKIHGCKIKFPFNMVPCFSGDVRSFSRGYIYIYQMQGPQGLPTWNHPQTNPLSSARASRYPCVEVVRGKRLGCYPSTPDLGRVFLTLPCGWKRFHPQIFSQMVVSWWWFTLGRVESKTSPFNKPRVCPAKHVIRRHNVG